MMVLGLVIQQQDTAAGVGRRLADQFASARFPRSSAHNNLPSLARQGLLRVVEQGSKRSLDRYEATPQGTARFREWLRESSPEPPALRDPLHAKLELCEEEDLLGLIEVIGEEEKACQQVYAAAHGRLIARRHFEGTRTRDTAWAARLQGTLITDEAMMWGMRTKRLQRLREELEDIRDELQRTRGGAGDG
jgi:DNA-binding PadR family transcriptional regulator